MYVCDSLYSLIYKISSIFDGSSGVVYYTTKAVCVVAWYIVALVRVFVFVYMRPTKSEIFSGSQNFLSLLTPGS